MLGSPRAPARCTATRSPAASGLGFVRLVVAAVVPPREVERDAERVREEERATDAAPANSLGELRTGARPTRDGGVCCDGVRSIARVMLSVATGRSVPLSSSSSSSSPASSDSSSSMNGVILMILLPSLTSVGWGGAAGVTCVWVGGRYVPRAPGARPAVDTRCGDLERRETDGLRKVSTPLLRIDVDGASLPLCKEGSNCATAWLGELDSDSLIQPEELCMEMESVTFAESGGARTRLTDALRGLLGTRVGTVLAWLRFALLERVLDAVVAAVRDPRREEGTDKLRPSSSDGEARNF